MKLTIDSLIAGIEDMSNKIDDLKEENERLKARVSELEGVLEAIAQHDGLTMLHPDENALVDEQTAYSQGVSAGYESLAAFARTVIIKAESEAQP